MPSPEELERLAKSPILDELRDSVVRSLEDESSEYMNRHALKSAELLRKAKATFDKKEKEYERLLQRLPNNRRF